MEVLLEESHLTDIASAIRTKTGSTELMKPREMAAAIEGIEGRDPSCNGMHIPDEALTVTGNCNYRFSYDGWSWFLNECGDRITTKDISNAYYMFGLSIGIKDIPFEINIKDGGAECGFMFTGCNNVKTVPSIDFKQTGKYFSSANMFMNCYNLESIGTIKNLYPSDMSSMFKDCRKLRHAPDFEGLNLARIREYNYSQAGYLFQNCYSLRTVPEDFLEQIYMPTATIGSYLHLTKTFTCCHALDEIRGINPKTGALTSNVFASGSGATFAYCGRVKDIVFATQDDGSPYVCNWKNQMIELNTCVGYVDFPQSVLNYNSGITADKEVKDDATYQALKNDPDWWTVEPVYCRYNKLSAINTINSLPDVSQGTGNTIKFTGVAGSKTDGGAINTMTEEEIAVAASKGWTVTFA